MILEREGTFMMYLHYVVCLRICDVLYRRNIINEYI